MKEPQIRPVTPGQEIPIVNTALDAPTYYVDMIANMSLDPTVAKLSFVESLATPDGLKGRFVVNVVFNKANLQNLIDNLNIAITKTDEMQVNQNAS